MTGKWKDSWKKLISNKNNLVIIILVGILLMIISWPVGKTNKSQQKSNDSDINNTSYDTKDTVTGTYGVNVNTVNEDDYIDKLEKKLSKLLSQVEGAGEVSVFITLKTSTERIIEKDTPVIRENTTEEDSEGGKRTTNHVDTKESTVYETSGTTQNPYVVKTISPKIEGVLILSEGASKGRVSMDLTDACRVLFGIDAHQVKVIKMECIGSQTN